MVVFVLFCLDECGCASFVYASETFLQISVVLKADPDKKSYLHLTVSLFIALSPCSSKSHI